MTHQDSSESDELRPDLFAPGAAPLPAPEPVVTPAANAQPERPVAPFVTMLKLSVPTSKRVLGFYLKPGGDTPGNTLVVVGGFASLVTGVCVLTGEVDGPALFDAVQAGNFWQWVVRPGGD